MDMWTRNPLALLVILSILFDLGSPYTKRTALADIEHIFAFGDSYTDVGFDATSTQHPEPSNYEGNPVPPGASAAYANNYVQDVCSEFNQSLIYLYDFAHSEAIVNSSLVSPYQSVNNTFTAQVDNRFLPYLTPSPGYAPWTSDNSLFIVFFGINDIDRAIGGSWPFDPDWNSKVPLIMDSYWNYVEKKSPGVVNAANASLSSLAKERTLLYNSNLATRHQDFQKNHGSTVFSKLVDVMGLWENMYAHPKHYGLVNVTNYCNAYYG
ncbi:hypothetical protein MMC10_007836 [Thelotrema lepadinum]|nr:hypothetical protein [Thelotrema lepadinum]